MANKDYYDILGVPRNASKDDIKKAFHKLAMKYHPDKKGGDEMKFKEINEAYTILSNDQKRAEYDSYGHVFNGQGGPGFQDFDFSQFTQGFDMGDIFGDFFGMGKDRQRRGRDISIDIEISFAESVFGVERKVLLTKSTLCTTCHGNGAKPGTEMVSCPSCNGKGKIHETKRSFLGTFTTVRTCDVCNGGGRVPKERCGTCRGEGVLERQEEISVEIPPGINDGEMIRMSGAGEAIQNGISGDLYIKIHVKRHHVFRKEGVNLHMDLDVKLSDALLGSEYQIETLDGDIKVKIPEGVTFGELLRVRGKGVPVGKGKRGDLLIRVKILLPSKLSKDNRAIIQKLRESGI